LTADQRGKSGVQEHVLTMAQALSDAEKIALTHEMAEAWHTLNWRKVADMFTPDGVLHSMMVDPVVGREAVYKRVAGLADGLESITLDLHHVGVIDGNIYMERTDRFVYRGKDGWTPVVGVLEFEGSLIKVWREYYDRHHLLSAMGLTEDFDQSTR
jgi:limonene-1,2-epoxide hydrolase